MAHQDTQEAFNEGWNAGRWDEPRNCPYFDRTRRRAYVEGYNDGKGGWGRKLASFDKAEQA